MNIGIFIFATDYAMRIDDLAKEAEARGFESLFVPEHTHIPTSRRSAWPGGAELPKEYWHTLDPFVALTAAAAATTKLRVGTGICLLTERDPLVTAKAVASLDRLSRGRVELGIGAGWNAEEMENHGTAFAARFRVMGERAKAIKTLWREEEPTFFGDFVHFDAVWSYPKPVQQPNPPILIGGESVHTLRRVVEYGDGWFSAGAWQLRSGGRQSALAADRRQGRTRHVDAERQRLRCAGGFGRSESLSRSGYRPGRAGLAIGGCRHLAAALGSIRSAAIEGTTRCTVLAVA